MTLIGSLLLAGCASRERVRPGGPETASVLVVQDYESAIDSLEVGTRCRVEKQPHVDGSGHFLQVEYAAPSKAGAGCDVWSKPSIRDFGAATALLFRVRPAQPMELDISLLDANDAAFAQRTGSLAATGWQDVRLAFDDFRFNSYAQPDRTPSELDLRFVRGLGFAPVGPGGGSFAVDDFALELSRE